MSFRPMLYPVLSKEKEIIFNIGGCREMSKAASSVEDLPRVIILVLIICEFDLLKAFKEGFIGDIAVKMQTGIAEKIFLNMSYTEHRCCCRKDIAGSSNQSLLMIGENNLWERNLKLCIQLFQLHQDPFVF